MYFSAPIKKHKVLFAALLLLSSVGGASASTIINGTRFIYPSDEKEITVQVDNKSGYPILLQSWIDDGNSQLEPEKMNVPFILTPPLTRVEANKGQTLRVTYIGGDLSKDREHIFWLNVLEIPPSTKDSKNHLQVAFRSRLKLFWRPSTLTSGASTSQDKLYWNVRGKSYVIENPTPYYMTLASISTVHDGKKNTFNGMMIEPHGSYSFESSVGLNATDKLEVEYINDYGAHKSLVIPNK
ncbi:TPA: molecular chaperone [Klebsiella quasipneumoniae subsp. quasipneumoniae]|nr:molecular chaperone [Klebsiella quasipneumoniae subsp. quasipneumoniae]